MKGTLLYASPPSLLVPWSAQGNPKCYYSTVGDSLCTIPVYLLSQNFRQHGMTFMNESADLSPLDSSHLSSHHSIKLVILRTWNLSHGFSRTLRVPLLRPQP